jgi:hypothetical protein
MHGSRGTRGVVEAGRHMRTIVREMKQLTGWARKNGSQAYQSVTQSLQAAI